MTMEIIISIVNVIYCLWVIFWDGAEKMTNTYFGYLDFGLANSPEGIRLVAWLLLIGNIVYLMYKFA
jgi:hypothetical protein